MLLLPLLVAVARRCDGSRLYRLNWFVCFYDCVLVPAPRAPWIAIGLTGRKGPGSAARKLQATRKPGDALNERQGAESYRDNTSRSSYGESRILTNFDEFLEK